MNTPTLTLQQIFDRVVDGLRKQGKKSLAATTSVDETGLCAYRGEGGTKCAVGLLIPDDKYTSKMEGRCAYNPIVWDVLVATGVPDTSCAQAFIERLQKIHDGHEVSEWETILELTAAQFGLNYTPPTGTTA